MSYNCSLLPTHTRHTPPINPLKFPYNKPINMNIDLDKTS